MENTTVFIKTTEFFLNNVIAGNCPAHVLQRKRKLMLKTLCSKCITISKTQQKGI